MNNDYLRLNSKEEDEDVVEGGFASQTEKIAEEKSREPQVTFFSLFGNDGGRAFGWNKNKTRGVLTLFLGSLLFSSALFLLASLTKSVASLMAVSVPLSSVVFFYGFNNMKNVGIFEISIGAFIGAAYFVVVELCSVRIDAVTSTGYMSENLKITLLTIGEDIILYAIAILCAKLFKKDCVFGTILIVVSIFGGYSVADTITKLVNGLFIDISVYGGTMSAIVADSSMIDKTLRTFFPALIKEGIVITVLMCLWFNSKQREEPYQVLTSPKIPRKHLGLRHFRSRYRNAYRSRGKILIRSAYHAGIYRRNRRICGSCGQIAELFGVGHEFRCGK